MNTLPQAAQIEEIQRKLKAREITLKEATEMMARIQQRGTLMTRQKEENK